MGGPTYAARRRHLVNVELLEDLGHVGAAEVLHELRAGFHGGAVVHGNAVGNLVVQHGKPAFAWVTISLLLNPGRPTMGRTANRKILASADAKQITASSGVRLLPVGKKPCLFPGGVCNVCYRHILWCKEGRDHEGAGQDDVGTGEEAVRSLRDVVRAGDFVRGSVVVLRRPCTYPGVVCAGREEASGDVSFAQRERKEHAGVLAETARGDANGGWGNGGGSTRCSGRCRERMWRCCGCWPIGSRRRKEGIEDGKPEAERVLEKVRREAAEEAERFLREAREQLKAAPEPGRSWRRRCGSGCWRWYRWGTRWGWSAPRGSSSWATGPRGFGPCRTPLSGGDPDRGLVSRQRAPLDRGARRLRRQHLPPRKLGQSLGDAPARRSRRGRPPPHRAAHARSDETQKILREAQGYFRNNAARMRYHRFRRQGLFIGSGVGEAAASTSSASASNNPACVGACPAAVHPPVTPCRLERRLAAPRRKAA